MDSYEKTYKYSYMVPVVSLQADIDNLFKCYMDLMRAFAKGVEDSVKDEISSDFVILYETYREKYGEPFVHEMRGKLVPKLTGSLTKALERPEGHLPGDAKGLAVLAVATGTLQILRVFEASGMDFEELEDAMVLWAELKKKHNK